MESRKVGNNTWLMRRDELVIVKLHRTAILTYHPDNRVVLNHGGWQTVTTKDRMNRYLSNRISSHYGQWRITVPMRIDYEHEVMATIPFENNMALDAATGRLVTHPEAKPIDLTSDLARLKASVTNLTTVAQFLRDRSNDGLVTNDDIDYAVMMANKYEEEQRALGRMLEDHERRVHWAMKRFEDALNFAARAHADQQTQEVQ